MRIAMILAAVALALSRPAAALTPCPISQFVVSFEVNTAEPTTDFAETLEAAYNSARQCDAPVFTLLAIGGDPLGRERTARVRDDLVALGLSAATPMFLGVSETPPSNAASAPELYPRHCQFRRLIWPLITSRSYRPVARAEV
jgi:hypothetical protein